MTKVEVEYELLQGLGEELLRSLEGVHTVYGIRSAKLNGAMDKLTVEYDASRLRLDEVDRALLGAGLPVRRKVA
jgi:hypothetical protein